MCFGWGWGFKLAKRMIIEFSPLLEIPSNDPWGRLRRQSN